MPEQSKKRLKLTPVQMHYVREQIEAQMNGERDKLIIIDAIKSVNVRELNENKTIRPNLRG